MAKDYVDSKVAKKKSAMSAAWILIALAVVFVFVVIKFAFNFGGDFNASGLPSNEDAFAVSKDFIKATVRSGSVEFPESRFQIDKKGDSTYVIRTVAELMGDSGDKKTSNFRVLMRYHGGKKDEMKNWALLNISEQ